MKINKYDKVKPWFEKLIAYFFIQSYFDNKKLLETNMTIYVYCLHVNTVYYL